MILIYIRKNNNCLLKCAFFLCLTIIYGCQSDGVPFKKSQFEIDHYEPTLKWGYIDENGDEVIGAKYDDARDFSEGLAAVNYNAYWGYIDKNGMVQIDFNYKNASAFNDGKAIVQDANNNWYVIDNSGSVLLSGLKSDIISLDASRVMVKSKTGLGLMTLKGDTLLDFKYSKILFIDGSNSVFVEQNGDWAIIDKDKRKKELSVDRIYPSDAKVFKFKNSGKYGFLDQYGEILIEPKYDEAYDFYQGASMVTINKTAFVLKESGESSHVFSLDSFTYHSPGYLVKSDADGLRLYDMALNIVVGEPYDMIYRPSDGIIGLMKDDMWGFYSIKGDCETGLIYPLVWEAKNGFARFIKMREGIGFIDEDCQEIIKAQFYEVRDYSEGLARFQKLN